MRQVNCGPTDKAKSRFRLATATGVNGAMIINGRRRDGHVPFPLSLIINLVAGGHTC